MVCQEYARDAHEQSVCDAAAADQRTQPSRVSVLAEEVGHDPGDHHSGEGVSAGEGKGVLEGRYRDLMKRSDAFERELE